MISFLMNLDEKSNSTDSDGAEDGANNAGACTSGNGGSNRGSGVSRVDRDGRVGLVGVRSNENSLAGRNCRGSRSRSNRCNCGDSSVRDNNRCRSRLSDGCSSRLDNSGRGGLNSGRQRAREGDSDDRGRNRGSALVVSARGDGNQVGRGGHSVAGRVDNDSGVGLGRGNGSNSSNGRGSGELHC